MDQRFRKHACVLIPLLSLVFGLLASLFPLPVGASEAEAEPTVILVVLEPGRTDTPIDLFLNAYGGTVLSDRTVVAPGTENAVSVRFTEPHGVPFSYKAYVKAELLQDGKPSDIELPLSVSVNNGSYKAFSDWFSEGDGVLVSSGSLSAGKQGSVDFSWKWAFERGDDAGDVADPEVDLLFVEFADFEDGFPFLVHIFAFFVQLIAFGFLFGFDILGFSKEFFALFFHKGFGFRFFFFL